MNAEKIASPAATKERCCSPVRVAKTMTFTRQIREDRALRRGVAWDICGKLATHRLDGQPYCAAHAGQRALEALLG